eukprot:CAMPEP_0203893968 /NCGR_PEP_ID=MMETSP0359-20131031/36979_1 /ASSEMBLY_ACC=CAM_ASM_000338 /TAXON_ID=268821 /ORGANISM="Scrippsiella Hangoei, Strain SHTV-5" /LENGTH=590 /DNA_ID=CAMNT_0050816213 /DNA_START=24 /DNA_END=1792 /DNA_ORIENTATION=-
MEGLANTSMLHRAACFCDLAGDEALQEFAAAAQCWHVGRKIPPTLYATANQVYQTMADRIQHLEQPPSLAGDLPYGGCVPGIFTALYVLLSLWEAHDAPAHLVDAALEHAEVAHQHFWAAPGVGSQGVRLDCILAVADLPPGQAWLGDVPVAAFERLRARLRRKRGAWQSLSEHGAEPWHPREVWERERGLPDVAGMQGSHGGISGGGGSSSSSRRGDGGGGDDGGTTGHDPRSLCLCVLHGEGAVTLNATLESWSAGGLLPMARQRFLAFLDGPDPNVPEEVSCWRQKLAVRYGFEVLRPSSGDWPDPFIRKRQRYGSPGAAMAACASACHSEYIFFLEDDWELVTRPKELVRHRIFAAMDILSNRGDAGGGGSCAPPVLAVHMRHKLFFGPPFYELLTAAQHNEPPSPYIAWYFSEDPVETRFPDDLWTGPFWDSRGVCDSQRRSWHATLHYQRRAAGSAERQCPRLPDAPLDEHDDSAASRVWWCDDDSSLLCASTAAHRDPFRSLMFSTNPMLYRTETWELHLASYAAVLQDLRAVEEAVSTSYMWRVSPTFTLALSLGLFRHRRLDRAKIPAAELDREAARCMAL